MNNLTKLYIERKEELEKNYPKFLVYNAQSGSRFLDEINIKLSQKSDILSVLDVVEKEIRENKRNYSVSDDFGEGLLHGNNEVVSDLLQFVSEAKDEIQNEK
jgi:hypothetical protein